MQKILYVEDDLSLIDGLKYTLENSGYFVDNARTASEALARFKQDTYDLLLLDTINMGVIAKTKQYGTMRAIGMSNQQLIKMIVAEAMTYAVSGIILGCIIGLPMHWVVFESLITNFWGTAWSIPIFPLALIIGIVLFTSFLAVRSPAKRLHDMAIVDTIKSQQ